MEKDILHINGNEYELEEPYIEVMKRRRHNIQLRMAALALGLDIQPLEQ